LIDDGIFLVDDGIKFRSFALAALCRSDKSDRTVSPKLIPSDSHVLIPNVSQKLMPSGYQLLIPNVSQKLMPSVAQILIPILSQIITDTHGTDSKKINHNES
jgi:hypothetical protein